MAANLIRIELAVLDELLAKEVPRLLSESTRRHHETQLATSGSPAST